MGPEQDAPDLFSRLVGDVESFSIEQRMVHLFLSLGGSLLLLFLPLNVALGLGWEVQVITVALAATFAGLFWALRVRRVAAWVGPPVLLLCSLAVLAYCVIADGSRGPGLLFLLVAGFVTATSSRGPLRIAAALGHVVAVCGVLFLEHRRPDLIGSSYADEGTRLADLALSWSLGFIILVGFGFAMQRGARELTARLQYERARSERLLLNLMPEPIASQLKSNPATLAEFHGEVTVLFADLVGFTQLSATLEPRELVELLDSLFTEFDRVVTAHGLEKIKTIGDAYMAAAGVPDPREDHADAALQAAVDMLEVVERHSGEHALQARIGLHSGPVVAGVIGVWRFAYDLWGETVNTASRMESHGLPGVIQLTESCRTCLRQAWQLEPRDLVEIKGMGAMRTWTLRPPGSDGGGGDP